MMINQQILTSILAGFPSPRRTVVLCWQLNDVGAKWIWQPDPAAHQS